MTLLFNQVMSLGTQHIPARYGVTETFPLLVVEVMSLSYGQCRSSEQEMTPSPFSFRPTLSKSLSSAVSIVSAAPHPPAKSCLPEFNNISPLGLSVFSDFVF